MAWTASFALTEIKGWDAAALTPVKASGRASS